MEPEIPETSRDYVKLCNQQYRDSQFAAEVRERGINPASLSPEELRRYAEGTNPGLAAAVRSGSHPNLAYLNPNRTSALVGGL